MDNRMHVKWETSQGVRTGRIVKWIVIQAYENPVNEGCYYYGPSIRAIIQADDLINIVTIRIENLKQFGSESNVIND